MNIVVIILNHNKPQSTDALANKLKEAFEVVEVWDSGSDPELIPMSLTESFENIYWEGAWREAMHRYHKKCDVLWIVGGDIVLKNSAREYRNSIEGCNIFGCWSPAIDGRAHPFMLEEHYNGEKKSVKNIEGMSLAVSDFLMKYIDGDFELTTKIGFGQDYWLCAMARKNGLPNYIDGSVSVFHPSDIGYNEKEAHDVFDEAFSKVYGKDFRRTLFEYSENFQENLFKESIMEEVKKLVIGTVDNGWTVRDFEAITSQFTQCRRIIMRKGVSDFGSETTAEILDYDDDMKEILNADIILFPRVGSANQEEFLRVLKAGIPVIVKEGNDGGRIVHEKNGFIYGHESWAIGWIQKLVDDEGLRLRIGGKSAHDNKSSAIEVQNDNAKSVEKSLQEEDKKVIETSVKVTIITPTFRRDPRIVSRCLDCVKLQTVTDIEQLVCSDGSPEPPIAALVGSLGDERISYHHTSVKKPGDYGNVVRSEMLKKARGEYILFLDDDNLILPDYLETMIKAIEESGKDFAVCRVVHFGPLNEDKYGKKPPVVLTGLPVKLYHVDPLQILVKKDVMQKVGWDTEKGYLADGYTLQSLGDKFEHVEVPVVLGFHI